MERRRMAWLLSLASLAVIVGFVSAYTGPDLPAGPYCAAKRRGCCNGREDDCGAPILGTMCYCDDFCNRTRNDDCCPDYFSHCHGYTDPEPLKLCYHNGIPIYDGTKAKENCNECSCTYENGQMEMKCDADPCMVEQELLENINSDPASSWTATNYSTFWGHKLSEGLKLRLGTLTPEKTLNMYPLRPIYDPNALPRSFDATNHWPNQLASIKDQGWCGSSWAISTADVASDRFVIMSEGLEHPQLSAQQLLSCNNRGQLSCHGGYLDRAWQFIRKFGLVNEECFPYVGAEKKCTIPLRGNLLSARCALPEDNAYRTDKYHAAPAHRLGNETDIMYEILNSGPVQATMKVYQDLFSYKDGVYRRSRHVPAEFGYHSIRLVGWGVEDGIKYWRVANSWGRNWGQDGYFKIVRGVNECEIEKFVIGAWVKTHHNNANRVDI